MVFLAMHSLAGWGRFADAVAVAQRFTAGGGELPPSLAKLWGELEAKAAAAGAGGEEQQRAGEEGAAGQTGGEEDAEKKPAEE